MSSDQLQSTALIKESLFPSDPRLTFTVAQRPLSNSLGSDQIGRVENFVSDQRPQEVAQSSGLAKKCLDPGVTSRVRLGAVAVLENIDNSPQSEPVQRAHNSGEI